ncbi:hypothetical protein Metev_2346 (plasmid) [Methanohalobium evestigatum Z-7303]|uniref:Uncharacterized protein n=1 Tax=Methanohalobium evestigatum (strain ATCC BAA-1072 / DSM 3721 / NBRC 107634 / OCM 161 / Z-7303) TaxID=644295 RepID=D7EC35_METEZ|nr:hypothetical protein Metev_2346 [Methanohalobium evestigatum Z-7303]
MRAYPLPNKYLKTLFISIFLIAIYAPSLLGFFVVMSIYIMRHRFSIVDT